MPPILDEKLETGYSYCKVEIHLSNLMCREWKFLMSWEYHKEEQTHPILSTKIVKIFQMEQNESFVKKKQKNQKKKTAVVYFVINVAKS